MKVRARAAGEKKMQRITAECPVCHQSITAEEIEVGLSLVCPRCDDMSEMQPQSPDINIELRIEDRSQNGNYFFSCGHLRNNSS